jgi:hypothetical protein
MESDQSGGPEGCIQRDAQKMEQTSPAILRNNKVTATEREFPYIVEIELPTNGLDLSTNREIMTFHRLHSLQPRFGRRRTETNKNYARWCFSDPAIADSFCEQFGGERVTKLADGNQ